MLEGNRRIAASIVAAINRFIVDRGSVQEVQSTLDGYAGLLDAGSSVRKWIHDAVEDLEMIRFGMLESEQRPAAVLRLDSLREQFENQLGTGPINGS